jgi:plastocyanin
MPTSRTSPRPRSGAALAVGVGVAAVLTLAAAGCSSDDGAEVPPATTQAGSTTTHASGTTEGSSGPTPATEDTVVVQDFEFTPATITVAGGLAVHFRNEDGFTHTATAGEPGKPSGTFDVRLSPGATGDVTVAAPGSYPYFCSIHQQMRGELVVSGG